MLVEARRLRPTCRTSSSRKQCLSVGSCASFLGRGTSAPLSTSPRQPRVATSPEVEEHARKGGVCSLDGAWEWRRTGLSRRGPGVVRALPSGEPHLPELCQGDVRLGRRLTALDWARLPGPQAQDVGEAAFSSLIGRRRRADKGRRSWTRGGGGVRLAQVGEAGAGWTCEPTRPSEIKSGAPFFFSPILQPCAARLAQ